MVMPPATPPSLVLATFEKLIWACKAGVRAKTGKIRAKTRIVLIIIICRRRWSDGSRYYGNPSRPGTVRPAAHSPTLVCVSPHSCQHLSDHSPLDTRRRKLLRWHRFLTARERNAGQPDALSPDAIFPDRSDWHLRPVSPARARAPATSRRRPRQARRRRKGSVLQKSAPDL